MIKDETDRGGLLENRVTKAQGRYVANGKVSNHSLTLQMLKCISSHGLSDYQRIIGRVQWNIGSNLLANSSFSG